MICLRRHHKSWLLRSVKELNSPEDSTRIPDLEGIDYDIKICDSSMEMKHIILEKNSIRNHARILAGY